MLLLLTRPAILGNPGVPQPSVDAVQIEAWLVEAERLLSARKSGDARSLFERAAEASGRLGLKSLEARLSAARTRDVGRDRAHSPFAVTPHEKQPRKGGSPSNEASSLDPPLRSLPGARSEVQEISRLLPAGRLTRLQAASASEPRLRGDLSEKFEPSCTDRRAACREVQVSTRAGLAALPEVPVFWAGFILAGEPD